MKSPYVFLAMMAIGCSVLLGSAFLVSAQVETEQRDGVTSFCGITETVYRDGLVEYECRIEDRSGTFYVVETDSRGTTERVASAREVAIYRDSIAERACFRAVATATARLATPAPLRDLITIGQRQLDIETLILAEC